MIRAHPLFVAWCVAVVGWAFCVVILWAAM